MIKFKIKFVDKRPMKHFLFFCLLSSVSIAFGGTSINIDHPRNPSHQKDSYSVNCSKECDLKIKTAHIRSGSASTELFESKINDIISIASNNFPVSRKLLSHQILYSIQASDGSRKVDVTLGYPKSYIGQDFQKYSAMIIKIEEIKREMVSHTVEKK